MNALAFDLCWLIGGSLSALILFKGFHAGWFTVKKQSSVVRVSPELLEQWRSEIVFNAVKGPRKLRAGQSRRPL